MNSVRLIFALLVSVSVGLTGCAKLSFDSSEKKFSELPNFRPLSFLERQWTRQVGVGTGDLSYSRIAPLFEDNQITAIDAEGLVQVLDLSKGDYVLDAKLQQSLVAGPVKYLDSLLMIGQAGTVISVDRTNGEELWRYALDAEVLSKPAAGRGVVVVQASNGQITGIDATTGEKKWVFDREVPVLALKGASSPVVVQGLVIVGLPGAKLLALELETGRLAWERRISIPGDSSELAKIVDIDADPVVSGNTVYVVSYQGNLAAVSIATGNVLWRKPLSSYVGLDVNEDEIVVVDADSNVFSLDRKTGETLWAQKRLAGRELSTPLIWSAYVAVGDGRGYVHLISRQSGRLLGRTKMASSAIKAKPLGGVFRLYFFSEDGQLAAFKVSFNKEEA